MNKSTEKSIATELGELNELLELNHFSEVQKRCEQLLKLFPKSHDLMNFIGDMERRRGNLEAAELAFRGAVELAPQNSVYKNKVSGCLLELGFFEKAVRYIESVISIDNQNYQAYFNLGLAYRNMKKLHDALEAFDKAIELSVDHAGSYFQKGLVLLSLGRPVNARSVLEKVLVMSGDVTLTHYYIAESFLQESDFVNAEIHLKKCIESNEKFSGAHFKLGVLFKNSGRPDAALASFKSAVRSDPNFSEAYFEMGNLFKQFNVIDHALTAFRHSVKAKPTNLLALNNLGGTLQDVGDLKGAKEVFETALNINPNDPLLHYNSANLNQTIGHYSEALEGFKKAISLNPNYTAAISKMVHLKAHMCDFSVFDDLKPLVATLGVTGASVSPFSMLFAEDNPENQKLRAVNWANENYTTPEVMAKERGGYSDFSTGRRLRVGYFTADLHDHATLFLMSGLFREHDRSRFEIFLYSYGSNKKSRLRDNTAQSIEHFFDISNSPDREVASLVEDHKLDIAIDLKGFTKNSRINLFAKRIAPVQISYLGFPGTLGTPFIDYIIADKTVIPNLHRSHYSEKIIFLPDSYQCNDNKRLISPHTTKRSDFFLPEDSFVFCCFNSNYKIGREEFKIWMHLLDEVDDSVLWLLQSNNHAIENLKKEASAANIDPDRLIFAKLLPHADHLERHRHADLFIDTFHYNAHTTASDAIWSGLPVVTKQGKQFSARVAASLLKATNLGDLVVETNAEYQALILNLANDRKKLNEIRSKMVLDLSNKPLFDTKQFTLDFEKGLLECFSIFLSGDKPRDLIV